MSEPDKIELVYGSLLGHLAGAARAGDDLLRGRIFQAVLVFEELWPQETERYRCRFSPKVERPEEA